ncbi:MAG: DUF5685 family protein [Oscillospiraceae bacterium]|nr:DUF5685 family protein [Oscillospiraceae bacterium]
MFGYIRPLQGELKVRELEQFKACYCGLCHALGKNYGFVSRFILNYELVFLTMLLWSEDTPITIGRSRCIASPCRKKRYCQKNESFDMCAGFSVILTWWKLRDSINDESFIKSLPYRAFSLILSRAYKKAKSDFQKFDRCVQDELLSLSSYESSALVSLDGAADKFANILKAAVPEKLPEPSRRSMSEMLYHLGRWVYIIDACDDYSGDVKFGRYNPIAVIYPSERGVLPSDVLNRLETTLIHSNNLVTSAFELLPENPWSQILQNMIYLGMPDACSRVLTHRWPPGRKNNKKWMKLDE